MDVASYECNDGFFKSIIVNFAQILLNDYTQNIKLQ